MTTTAAAISDKAHASFFPPFPKKNNTHTQLSRIAFSRRVDGIYESTTEAFFFSWFNFMKNYPLRTACSQRLSITRERERSEWQCT